MNFCGTVTRLINLMDIIVNSTSNELPEGSIPIKEYGNFYCNLYATLHDTSEYMPIADLLRKYHGLEGKWLVVSLINWQASHNDAMITASFDNLKLTDEESRLWFNDFKEFLALDNIDLYYHNKDIWLLRSDKLPPITAKNVYNMHNQSIMPALHQLDKTLYWQKFITESQMFLSSNILNKGRALEYNINGVWVWGAGVLPKLSNKKIVCNDKESFELAKLLSTNVEMAADISYAKSNVILFNNFGVKESDLLCKYLKKHTVNWYWNNIAYNKKSKSLMRRCMEFFTRTRSI